jgi:hypothetical protein
MFDLNPDPDDDPNFVELVSRLIGGAAAVHQPGDVRIYKIDNWFDHKWLRFSGKVIGAVGIWASDLTIPPFVFNRVVRRWHYLRGEFGTDYRLLGPGPDIHHRGWSARNLQRRVRQIAPTSALFWFSGNTSETGRGSLMAYIPVEQDHWPWFLAFARAAAWKIIRRKNIHPYEVRLFQEAAGRRVATATPATLPLPKD